jgi:hypothetical protein
MCTRKGMHECVRVIGTAHTAVREGILSPFAACAPSIAPQNGAYAIGAQNDEMRDETDRRCVSACGEVKSPLRVCCTIGPNMGTLDADK